MSNPTDTSSSVEEAELDFIAKITGVVEKFYRCKEPSVDEIHTEILKALSIVSSMLHGVG